MNNKKLIIFGCSFAPLLIAIVGAITYFASSKNNVHQNNLQLEEEVEEVVVMKNQEEEYIPFLDNDKIQISLWFIMNFILLWPFFGSPKNIFASTYQVFWFNFKQRLNKNIFNVRFIAFIIVVIIFYLISEFILSFIYLPACWINKKHWKKAFSIYHRFWWKSWTNLFLSFIIAIVFFLINDFLIMTIKYFIGSFYYDEITKENIADKNLSNKNQLNKQKH